MHLQQRRSIRTDAVDGGVGKRQQPREANQNVQPQRQNYIDQHQVADEQRVLIGNRWKQQERAEQQR